MVDFPAIEAEARYVHRAIWNRFGAGRSPDLLANLDLLEPGNAATVLGLQYEEHEDLGRFGSRDSQFETAGALDRQERRVLVSLRFDHEAVRFTGAHEIGHFLLHDGEVHHRDRPIRGMAPDGEKRSPVEREADYFAAAFLVPAKSLEYAMAQRFGRSVLEVDDTAAFWLSMQNPSSMRYPEQGSLARELAVASLRFYAGNPFTSLASLFGVSPLTLAIRLRELKLVQP